MGTLVSGAATSMTIKLEQPDGTIHTGEAANLSVTAHLDGVATSVSETITEVGTTGYYKVSFTLPASAGFFMMLVEHSGSSAVVGGLVSGPVMAYDTDDLVAELQQSAGGVSPLTADDADLGDVVEGDDWNSGTLTVPLAKISPLGYSDLTGMTISAQAMKAVDGTPVSLTANIVSIGSRTFNIGWSGGNFPAAMVLDAGDTEQDWFIDVQFKHTASGNILTTNRYKLRVVWERNTTT